MAVTKILSDKDNARAPTAADLEAQIAELRNEIASLTKNIAAFGSAKMDDYRSGIDHLAADAMAASVSALNTVKSEAVSLEESLEEHVRTRPLQSVGIAVGVGFLLALLTRRG